MTGIAEFYLYLRRPTEERRKLLFGRREKHQRFVVLSWRRTGSNLLCGILWHHPEIVMHNELFNPIDIFSYRAQVFKQGEHRWSTLSRDLAPDRFLKVAWSGKDTDGEPLKPEFKAVGFKSFPDHWYDARNEDVFERAILADPQVKKIVLKRNDELAVFVSMKRAEETGLYLGKEYPEKTTVKINPAEFQTFLNNYRHAYQRKYKSPSKKSDTFVVDYEQLVDERSFEKEILPKLFEFLGVDPSFPLKKLRETVQQSRPDEELPDLIENWGEVEFCFRHSDVKFFAKRCGHKKPENAFGQRFEPTFEVKDSTWSLLLPICSRGKSSESMKQIDDSDNRFNTNRLLHLSITSQHHPVDQIDEEKCWRCLREFCESLKRTCSTDQLARTECIIGIDEDDAVYQNEDAKLRIRKLLPCCVIFVDIGPPAYGKICKIWNQLARRSSNDYIVLLGDDVRLFDQDWQTRISSRFHSIAARKGLPLGAACVAFWDASFPGFPTFPVVHRWHLECFGSLLPRQFVNQGGDPYLFELYSRFNASFFETSCCLENTIGGDGEARYVKHDVTWRGQVLQLSLRNLAETLGPKSESGVVLDVVVPSYRINNDEILQSIGRLRASVDAYVKFWFVVDNPVASHVGSVKALASRLNEEQRRLDGNYFINVLHYGENRGASYARNHGFNFSTADWVFFIDDDVVPDEHLLDAYVGALKRHPRSKVFVGLTQLPDPFNFWTEMVKTCNIAYFYGVSKLMPHPSWGVTANLMVRGSRHNTTIQFKHLYPKTGGGEDIDFVFQFKRWYKDHGVFLTAAVPEASAKHPWWNQGRTCYRQIAGWAWGDSLCLTEWPEKTYFVCPNWIENILFLVTPLSIYTKMYHAGFVSSLFISAAEHVWRGVFYWSSATRVCDSHYSLIHRAWVALGAGTIMSAQEITRAVACIRRMSLFGVCRRVDWYDGQQPNAVLDAKLYSLFQFGAHATITWLTFRWLKQK